MLKKKCTIKLGILAVFTLLLIFAGCGQDNKTSDKKNSTTNTFKISKSEMKDEGVESKQNSVKKSSDTANVNAGETGAEGDIQKTGVNEATEDGAPAEKTNQKADDLSDAGQGHYDPKTRIDPFEPLFQEAEKKQATTSGARKKTIREKRVNLTPLEKFDISQLKLVAIIKSKHRNIAMVEEATGKGYVVKKGTYIGINSGRVIDIKNDVVIIEEEVEDYMGKLIIRKRELKLQKPLGE